MKKAQVGSLLRKFAPEGARKVASLTAKKEMERLAEKSAAKKLEAYQPKRTLSNIFETAREDFKGAVSDKTRSTTFNPNRAINMKREIKANYKAGGKLKAKSGKLVSKKVSSAKKSVASRMTKKKK